MLLEPPVSCGLPRFQYSKLHSWEFVGVSKPPLTCLQHVQSFYLSPFSRDKDGGRIEVYNGIKRGFGRALPRKIERISKIGLNEYKDWIE